MLVRVVLTISVLVEDTRSVEELTSVTVAAVVVTVALKRSVSVEKEETV